MQPLLILFINLGVGGVQRKIVDICNFLSKDKPNLLIYLILRNRDDYDLSSEIKNKKVKIIYYTRKSNLLHRLLWPFFPIFVIWQIFKIKPSAVLSFLDFASIPAIWARLFLSTRKFRLVLSENHYTSRVVPLFKFGKIRNILIKIFYRYADVVFSCSQAGRQDLVKNYGLPRGKVKVFRSWTTFTKTLNTKYLIQNTQKEYDLVYVGRFYWTKNLGFLIKGLAKLKKIKQHIRLLLVGTGQEEKNLRNLVKKYQLEENVAFLTDMYIQFPPLGPVTFI